MEESHENSIFKIGNSQIVTKSSSNDTENHNCIGNGLGNNSKQTVSESNSDDSSNEENISKFDKYVYTFLLCYCNLTYVSLKSTLFNCSWSLS